MRQVQRSDIIDYQTYSDGRDAVRERVLELKKPRRIHVGEHLTFLFENTETIIYQIQEMLRAEQIARESDIVHEIETYNELVGGDGELGCTLLIEIPNPDERDRLLRQWLPLVKHVYLGVAGGEKVYASFDERQVGDERLSSVQYLIFDTGGRAPERVGCDWDGYAQETVLDDAQRAALAADLAG